MFGKFFQLKVWGDPLISEYRFDPGSVLEVDHPVKPGTNLDHTRDQLQEQNQDQNGIR